MMWDRWARPGATAAFLVSVAMFAFPAISAGQDPPMASGPVAAPYLAPEHWAIDVLRQLDAAGLTGSAYHPALPGFDRVEAFRLMRSAMDAAREQDIPLAPLIESYLQRFTEEFPRASRHVAAPDERVTLGGSRISAGAATSEGELLTTVGTPPLVQQPWEPEQPAEQRPDESNALVELDVSGYWGRAGASRVEVGLRGDRLQIGETYVVGAVGPVTGWAGRRRLRLGYGTGGIIVSGAIPTDGVGVAVEPFRLPWILERLGDVRVGSSLGRMGRSMPYENPWLWLMRVSLEPHERLVLAINRGAMAVPVEGGFFERLQQIAYIAIGKHGAATADNWRDNQIASAEIRYRPPLGPLPLALYLEWGLDDSAGSWKDVPGIVAGAYLGALPGAPWLTAGVERTHFAPRCCGNIWWYRHSGFQGGWSDERRPLGHPLGGHGDEWAGRWGIALGSGRTLLNGRVFWRDRGSENLFAPTFEGESTGGSLEVTSRIVPEVDLGLEAEYEVGASGWTRLVGELRASLLF